MQGSRPGGFCQKGDTVVLDMPMPVRRQTITAVPYYAWNNRGKGEMEVWVPY